MIALFDEALGLLSKWKSESVGVRGILVVDGGAVTFGGLIKFLSPDALVITQYAKPGQKVAEVKLALGTATAFEYGDVREIPEEIRDTHFGKISSILVIHIPGGICTLFAGEPS